MSTLPNYSINYYAPLASGAAVSIGQVMLPNSVDGSYYVVATTANRGTRRSYGVAISAWNATTNNVGTFRLQQDGILPAAYSGLAAGSASWVRCSATGTIERFTPAPGGSSDIIGKCEADGSVHLEFGIWTEDLAVGGGGGATLSGTTNGLVYLSGANAGTADQYWQRTANGVLATNYVNNGVIDVGHITIIGNGETYAGASKPLDGFLRLSNQIAAINSFPIVAYQSDLLGTDPWVLGVDHGKPVFGDPTHLAEVDIIGDGVLIDAGPGGAGAVSSFTGEVQVNCKATTSAGGFTTCYFGFQSSGAPPKGVASFDGGNPSRLRSSIGTANQLFLMNSGGTDFTFALLANANVASNAAISGSKLFGTGNETINAQSFTGNIDAKGTPTYVEAKHVQTTDATTAQTLDSIATTNNSAVTWTATVVGVKSDYTAAASYSVSALFRNNAGTMSRVGTATVTTIAADDATWVGPTMTASGTTAILSTKGKASTTITWSVISTELQVVA